MTWYHGGVALSIFGEPIKAFGNGAELKQMFGKLISMSILFGTEAILLSFACKYFKAEQAEGTPFTKTGAEMVKKLGIRCIYIPIVAVVVVSAMLVCLGVDDGMDINNLPGVGTGIVLILVSLIFRYGAELEEKVSQ